MPKKYHQTRKDKRDERRGMEEHYDHRKLDHRYNKMKDPRHADEGDMKHVLGHDPMWGRDAHAGMPSKLEMSHYPKPEYDRDRTLDDTMYGIDRCDDQAMKMRRSDVSYQK